MKKILTKDFHFTSCVKSVCWSNNLQVFITASWIANIVILDCAYGGIWPWNKDVRLKIPRNVVENKQLQDRTTCYWIHHYTVAIFWISIWRTFLNPGKLAFLDASFSVCTRNSLIFCPSATADNQNECTPSSEPSTAPFKSGSDVWKYCVNGFNCSKIVKRNEAQACTDHVLHTAAR